MGQGRRMFLQPYRGFILGILERSALRMSLLDWGL